MSFPMPSLLGGDVETTGSIIPGIELRSQTDALPTLDEEDWRRARSAMSLALDPQGPGTLVGWDNPDTGKKGSFVPDGAPFVEKNDICRAFIAEFISSNVMQPYIGKSCRISGEEWRIVEFTKKKSEGVNLNSVRNRAATISPSSANTKSTNAAPLSLAPR